MRVLITGDRHWHCSRLAADVVARLVAKYGPNIVIVHGDAEGVDRSFDAVAIAAGVAIESHSARWKDLGPRAGPVRNAAMVDAGADLCLAVHRTLEASKGTKGCAALAIAAGIPTYLIDADDGVPRRLRADDPRLAR